MHISLSDFPEWQEMQRQFAQQARELIELRQMLPQWVDQVEAERLTGLSRTALWRERQNPRSLIKWKEDRGVRYDRASLLAHDASRTVRRGASSPTA